MPSIEAKNMPKNDGDCFKMNCSRCGRRLTLKECGEAAKIATIALIVFGFFPSDKVFCPECSKKNEPEEKEVVSNE